MSVTKAKWTVSEYQRLVHSGSLDDKPVELLQGDIVHMTPEGPLHSNRIRESVRVLRQQISDVYEVSETHPITLEQSEPEPDIAVVQNHNYDQRHPNGDDTALVIEFAQTSLEKDLEEKRITYAQAAIPEYWVVNLRDRHVVVFTEPSKEDYQQQRVVTSGEIQSQTIKTVSIAVTTLTGKHED